MKTTLQTLNLLKKEGIISGYAIGGAVAAYFYIEPTLTDDMDVFIVTKNEDGPFITLAPLYNRLKELGYSNFEKEGVVIGKWPVQFLPAGTDLEKEALDNSREDVIEGEPIRVFTAEYLMAICVKVGRAKDKIRLSQFVSEGEYDKSLFDDILKRHNLDEKWEIIRKLICDE